MKLLSKRKTVALGVFIGVPIGIIISYYGLYLAAGTIAIATDVLKSLVDADAALLGFLGVITVFILATYRDSINRIEEEIFRLDWQMQHVIRSSSDAMIGHEHIQAMSKSLKEEYKLFTDRKKKLQDRSKSMKATLSTIYFGVIGSASLFVISILFCLLAMSEVPLPVRFFSTYFASGLMVCGVIFMFFIIVDLKDIFERNYVT